MCGICGTLLNDPERLGDKAQLERMTEALRHRGADHQGVAVGPGYGLGASRLAIFDVNPRAHQPLVSADGALTLVFNGAIYNFPELRRDLEERGHHFRTRGDAEVVLHLYEEKGVRSLEDLRGMFALAIYDRREGCLFAARDRFGQKPFFYTETEGDFVFASEIKPLLLHGGMRAFPDHQALCHYLSLGYVPGEATAFTGIKRLPPAHYLLWRRGHSSFGSLRSPSEVGDTPLGSPLGMEGVGEGDTPFESRGHSPGAGSCGRISVRRYWSALVRDYGRKPSFKSKLEQDLSRELLECLREAVRLRLRSDVPLGILLSGGVDSSAVAALAAAEGDKPPRTYSIGFSADDRDYDELPWAGRVAGLLGTRHRENRLEADVVTSLPRIVRHLEEPFADSSAIATDAVAQMAAREVKVVLTGDGGDECFAGYLRYGASRAADILRIWIPRFLMSTAARAGQWGARFLGSSSGIGYGERIARFLRHACEPTPERYYSWVTCLDREKKSSILTPEFFAATRDAWRSSARSDPAFRFFHSAWSAATNRDPLDRLLYIDRSHYLPSDLLVKMDRMCMAWSLEARSPFLDHELFEFAATIPAALKLKGLFGGKHILKKSLQDILPPGILKRRKHGFGVPIDRWLRQGPLHDFTREILLDRVTKERGIFDIRSLEGLIEDHSASRHNAHHQIYALLMLELWFREFIEF